MKFKHQYNSRHLSDEVCTVDGEPRVTGFHIKGDREGIRNIVDMTPTDPKARHLTETHVQEVDLDKTEPMDRHAPPTTLEVQIEEGLPFVLKLNGCSIRCQGIDIYKEGADSRMTADIRGLYIEEATIDVGDDD